MSLVNFAIRICLQKALIGRTHAEGRVYDSRITPIDEVTEDEPKPVIIVSTDDDQTMGTVASLQDPGQRALDVIVEMALAGPVDVQVELEDGSTVNAVEVRIPHTDDSMEMLLDFMQRRVMRALAEPNEPWADLFRRFIGDSKRILKRRGADANKDGVKFAARQLVITCDPRSEPAYGEAPKGVWLDLIEMMRGDEELTGFADMLAQEIEGAPLPSWAALQASLGWTDAEGRALGSAPLDPDETGEAPLVETIVLERVDADGDPLVEIAITDGEPASFEVPT